MEVEGERSREPAPAVDALEREPPRSAAANHGVASQRPASQAAHLSSSTAISSGQREIG